MMKIWLDITFVITIATYITKNLNYIYIKTIKTILHYLKKSINYGIIYNGKKTLFIKGYLNFN